MHTNPFLADVLQEAKADLNIGDLIEIVITSNYGRNNKEKYIFQNSAR